jgi:hypothetical protein
MQLLPLQQHEFLQLGRAQRPVFVLCAARSGSTLTRFLLDAHPDLACPPETDLPAVCDQLAKTWSLLAGDPLLASTDGKPPEIPEAAAAGIRQSVGAMIGQYLVRRGKTRYCDKSLYAARHADLLVRVFPDARFICLYRHPMDVIASGIEACPWGLKGFGFDSYVASTPGNSVLALARFWADHATTILEVEDRFADRCHRVRYEDLVTEPDVVADGVFDFLGVRRVPGISEACFAPERERLGPADYKIWNTSKVTADSVGRGWSLPASRIDATVLATINELADRLGYIKVDRTWGAEGVAPDPRVRGGDQAGAGRPPAGRATMQMPRAFVLLGDLLQTGLFKVSDQFVRRWGPQAGETFLVQGMSPTGQVDSVRWHVDLAARTVALSSGAEPGGETGNGAGHAASWQIIGSADAWDRVIGGRTNLSVALRHRELRYCDTGDPGHVSVARIGMLADLLDIASWRSTAAADNAQAVPAA